MRRKATKPKWETEVSALNSTAQKTYVFAAHGGLYAGTPLDTQTAYLRNFLRFRGIEDVEFVYAERLNMGEASKQAGLEQAQSAIRR